MKTHADWNNEKGDSTHRLNYNLNDKSLVFDLGGYRGQWALDINKKYNCNIYVFEPSKPYFDGIVNLLKTYEKIKIFNFGLGDSNSTLTLYMNNDASSTHIKTGESEEIKLIEVSEFISGNKITNIDLIKINIEGGEYSLLEKIIKDGITTIFDNFQIQFHSMVDNHVERKKQIKNELSKTHHLTYEFDVWENWKRNEK